MTTFSPTDFQANFPDLLKRVNAGERIEISESGTPIAVLVPAEPTTLKNPAEIARIVEEMIAWRDRYGPGLGEGCTIRDLIEEGRR